MMSMAVDPRHVRRPSRGFGWIDHRIHSGGHLAGLDCTQIAAYFTLCLVADRHGISFYRPETLARIINRPVAAVARALDELVRHGLIARDGRYIQVRDLDEVESPGSPADGARMSAPALSPPVAPDPATPAADQILARLAPGDRERLLERARRRLEGFLGVRAPRPGALAATAVSILREEEVSRRGA